MSNINSLTTSLSSSSSWNSSSSPNSSSSSSSLSSSSKKRGRDEEGETPSSNIGSVSSQTTSNKRQNLDNQTSSSSSNQSTTTTQIGNKKSCVSIRGCPWIKIENAKDNFNAFKVPLETKFGGGPNPSEDNKIIEHDFKSIKQRLENRRKILQNKLNKTLSESASVAMIGQEEYVKLENSDKIVNNWVKIAGNILERKPYHEAAVCESNFTLLAQRITEYLKRGYLEAMYYAHDCAVARREEGGENQNPSHEQAISICQKLYNVLQQLGTAAIGATCIFTGSEDPRSLVYKFTFSDGHGNFINITHLTIGSINASNGGRRNKTYRKTRKHQRKTRKQLKK